MKDKWPGIWGGTKLTILWLATMWQRCLVKGSRGHSTPTQESSGRPCWYTNAMAAVKIEGWYHGGLNWEEEYDEGRPSLSPFHCDGKDAQSNLCRWYQILVKPTSRPIRCGWYWKISLLQVLLKRSPTAEGWGSTTPTSNNAELG